MSAPVRLLQPAQTLGLFLGKVGIGRPVPKAAQQQAQAREDDQERPYPKGDVAHGPARIRHSGR